MSAFDDDLDAQVTDTLQETDKKCTNCGGVMEFDPESGGLKCPYCGNTVSIEETVHTEHAKELDFDTAEETASFSWGTEKKTVVCKACGAETVYDALEISGVCPFCGSNQVMEAADRKTMAPGGVVPFGVTAEAASDHFRKWIKKKWFCPKLARESARAKQFKGVYLPYWTFDADTETQYTAQFGRDREVKHGEEKKVVTDWFPTSGTYRESFDDELVCATDNHNQSMLLGLEPYHTEKNVAYKPEYVAGFAAERYAVGLKEAFQYAKENIKDKLKSNITSKIRREKNADHVKDLMLHTYYSNITYKYLLLPVWISSYKYKDKVYQFMVNGQTGKVAGKTPISPVKVAFTVAAVIIACVLIYLLMHNGYNG